MEIRGVAFFFSAPGKSKFLSPIDLAVAGKRFKFDVSELDIIAAKVAGQKAVQFSLPLLQTRF